MSPFSIKTFTLLLTTLLSGLLAGVFFTWANAVTKGIGRLNDISYLDAFQQMNRSILNPLFFMIFLGPCILLPITTYLHRSSSNSIFAALLLSSLIYIFGVFGTTIFGNIPLNELLDSTAITEIRMEEARMIRDKFEGKWNSFHYFRTCLSGATFILLLFICIYSHPNAEGK